MNDETYEDLLRIAIKYWECRKARSPQKDQEALIEQFINFLNAKNSISPQDKSGKLLLTGSFDRKKTKQDFLNTLTDTYNQSNSTNFLPVVWIEGMTAHFIMKILTHPATQLTSAAIFLGGLACIGVGIAIATGGIAIGVAAGIFFGVGAGLTFFGSASAVASLHKACFKHEEPKVIPLDLKTEMKEKKTIIDLEDPFSSPIVPVENKLKNLYLWAHNLVCNDQLSNQAIGPTDTGPNF